MPSRPNFTCLDIFINNIIFSFYLKENYTVKLNKLLNNLYLSFEKHLKFKFEYFTVDFNNFSET